MSMIDMLFRQVAAEERWSDAAQVSVLLRLLTRAGSPEDVHAALASERAAAANEVADDRFTHDVIAVLRDPGLALDAGFRRYCAGCRDLLTARQAAERWCCWRGC